MTSVAAASLAAYAPIASMRSAYAVGVWGDKDFWLCIDAAGHETANAEIICALRTVMRRGQGQAPTTSPSSPSSPSISTTGASSFLSGAPVDEVEAAAALLPTEELVRRSQQPLKLYWLYPVASADEVERFAEANPHIVYNDFGDYKPPIAAAAGAATATSIGKKKGASSATPPPLLPTSYSLYCCKDRISANVAVSSVFDFSVRLEYAFARRPRLNHLGLLQRERGERLLLPSAVGAAADLSTSYPQQQEAHQQQPSPSSSSQLEAAEQSALGQLRRDCSHFYISGPSLAALSAAYRASFQDVEMLEREAAEKEAAARREERERAREKERALKERERARRAAAVDVDAEVDDEELGDDGGDDDADTDDGEEASLPARRGRGRGRGQGKTVASSKTVQKNTKTGPRAAKTAGGRGRGRRAAHSDDEAEDDDEDGDDLSIDDDDGGDDSDDDDDYNSDSEEGAWDDSDSDGGGRRRRKKSSTASKGSKNKKGGRSAARKAASSSSSKKKSVSASGNKTSSRKVSSAINASGQLGRSALAATSSSNRRGGGAAGQQRYTSDDDYSSEDSFSNASRGGGGRGSSASECDSFSDFDSEADPLEEGLRERNGEEGVFGFVGADMTPLFSSSTSSSGAAAAAAAFASTSAALLNSVVGVGVGAGRFLSAAERRTTERLQAAKRREERAAARVAEEVAAFVSTRTEAERQCAERRSALIAAEQRRARLFQKQQQHSYKSNSLEGEGDGGVLLPTVGADGNPLSFVIAAAPPPLPSNQSQQQPTAGNKRGRQPAHKQQQPPLKEEEEHDGSVAAAVAAAAAAALRQQEYNSQQSALQAAVKRWVEGFCGLSGGNNSSSGGADGKAKPHPNTFNTAEVLLWSAAHAMPLTGDVRPYNLCEWTPTTTAANDGDDDDASGVTTAAAAAAEATSKRRGRLGRTVRLLAVPHVPTDPSAFSSAPSSSDAADRNAAAALAGGLTVEAASSAAFDMAVATSSLRVTSVPSHPFFAAEAHPLTTAAAVVTFDDGDDGAASQAASPAPGLFTVSQADAAYVEGCLAIATARLKTGLLRLAAAEQAASGNEGSDGRLPSVFGEFASTYFLPPSAADAGKKGGKKGSGAASAVVAAATARLSEWARAPIAEAPAVASLMGTPADDEAGGTCGSAVEEADAVAAKEEQHYPSADPATLLSSAAGVVGLSASEEDLLAAQRDLLLCVLEATGKSMEGGGF